MRYDFAGFVLDDARLELSGPEGAVHLEPQVFSLLLHLVRHADRVVTKEELLDEVWGDRFVSESALTSRVKAARRAVGDDGTAQQVIRTVHGRGYQLIARVQVQDASLAPPGSAPRAAPTPQLRTALIGRSHDLEQVAQRVRRSRLVTITGPGGIGKTTLSLVVAGQLAPEHADGVAFVDLASVGPDADLTRVVAGAAGVQGGASESIDALIRHLADRPLLVVLDNCEHVLEQATDLVARLLDVGGPARVLATSREPLGVVGEHVWPLGPLEEAPELFVARARAAEPRLDWHEGDPDVVEVCRRLDGLPLALELAAGQLRRFELAELLQRLGQAPSLLTGAAGGAPRHATMDATIDWGYRLLDEDEQALLRQLGVFPSSFDLTSVERSAPPLASLSPVAALGQLVDKSLVVRQPGTGRYRLLETIRAFTAARRHEHGETEAALERHRRSVLQRASATSRLDRWMSGSLAAAYRDDLDDARLAFRSSLEAGSAADAVEIAVGASFLWRNAIACAEGLGWVDELARHDLDPRDQLWLHILRADVGQGRGDAAQMFGAALDAERLAVESPDAAAACVALHYATLLHIADRAEADRRLAAALERAAPLGDVRVANVLDVFRCVAAMVAGAYDDARALAVDLERRRSSDGYDNYLTNWAGWLVALAERDAPTARRWISQQHEYLARTGFENWLVAISTSLCDVIDGGDHRARTAATLALAEREGYDPAGDCVLVLAYAELFADRFEAAAELVGTALAAGINSTVSHVLLIGAIDRPLRGHLDAATMSAAVERGRARRAADVLAAALAS